MFPYLFKNTTYMVTFSTQLVLKKYYAIYKRPSQLLAFSVSFILFFNPHIAMRNLALFKKPAL